MQVCDFCNKEFVALADFTFEKTAHHLSESEANAFFGINNAQLFEV